jgi:hypothetical protein
MGINPSQRLSEWLKTVRNQEGYGSAKETIEDWVCILEEMAEAGLDVSAIMHQVRSAANGLNIAISSPEQRNDRPARQGTP